MSTTRWFRTVGGVLGRFNDRRGVSPITCSARFRARPPARVDDHPATRRDDLGGAFRRRRARPGPRRRIAPPALPAQGLQNVGLERGPLPAPPALDPAACRRAPARPTPPVRADLVHLVPQAGRHPPGPPGRPAAPPHRTWCRRPPRPRAASAAAAGRGRPRHRRRRPGARRSVPARLRPDCAPHHPQRRRPLPGHLDRGHQRLPPHLRGDPPGVRQQQRAAQLGTRGRPTAAASTAVQADDLDPGGRSPRARRQQQPTPP